MRAVEALDVAAEAARAPSPLTHLRRAVDPAAVLAVLEREWPYPERHARTLAEVEVLRVFPRRDGGFTVLYEIGFDEAGRRRVEQFFGQIVFGDPLAAAAAARRRLAKARRGQLADGSTPDAVCGLPGLAMVLRRAGLDEKLPGLRVLRSPDSAVGPFSRYLGADAGRSRAVRAVRAELLGHRLGKRAVVRLRFERDGSGAARRSVIAKFYRPGGRRGWASMAAMQVLRTGGFGASAPAGVPRPLGYVGEWGALLMEDVPGRPLDELDGTAADDGARRAGQALAGLHRMPFATPERHAASDERALLARWVDLAAAAMPEHADPIRSAFPEVAARLDKAAGARPALIHRDFHDKQVLVTPSTTTVIDFDTLALGDPALDVGNYLAHVDLWRPPGKAGRRLAAAFLDGYAREGADDGFAERVDAYRRAARLRLACLYVFSGRMRDRALRCLGPGGLDTGAS